MQKGRGNSRTVDVRSEEVPIPCKERKEIVSLGLVRPERARVHRAPINPGSWPGLYRYGLHQSVKIGQDIEAGPAPGQHGPVRRPHRVSSGGAVGGASPSQDPDQPRIWPGLHQKGFSEESAGGRAGGRPGRWVQVVGAGGGPARLPPLCSLLPCQDRHGFPCSDQQHQQPNATHG